MKKLGLVGGIGPESTIPYYRGIVYGVHEKLGEGVMPLLTIESINVFDIQTFCTEERYDDLTEYLLKAIRSLAAAGADFAAMSANTPHIVFDRLKEQSPIPLISIIEAACQEALMRNITRIGLLGTIFTMEGSFFKTPFTEQGIQVITPHKNEMDYINEKIYKELEFAQIKEETQKRFIAIVRRMMEEDGIEAIILGCTELPLILNDEISPVPCLDTVKIHVKTLIEEIVG